MHPTIAEQAAAVRRSLEALLAANDRGPWTETLTETVTDASRRLQRIESSAAARAPFLHSDNEAMTALLREVTPRASQVAAELDAIDRRPPAIDEHDAHERNKVLRALLSRIILAEPRPGSADVHRLIARRLLRRLAADPSLQRDPEPYAYESSQPATSDGPPTTLAIDDEHFAEQFPLTPLDDYMIHQTPDPIRVMWTGDPRAYERYWMVCNDPQGEVLVAAGGSFYPNLDRAEAYVIVNVGGLHTTVRGFRKMGADRTDLRIGPIAPRIVRGMRHWCFELEPNEWGISCSLDFRDTTRQTFREPLSNSSGGFPPGRRGDVTTGFESFGEVEGWVEAQGRRVVLPPGSPGTRDRHWGVGRGVGGPALSLGGRLHVGTSGNGFVAFSSWTLWGDRAYFRFGDSRRGAVTVARPNRRLRFDPDTKIFAEGIVEYSLSTGERKVVHYERIGQQTAYLRCGMYGGTPNGNIHQGAYDGPDLVEGETFDVNDPVVRTSIAGLDEHLCRVTCDGETTTGIYQPIDPVAYEACSAGRPGWAFL
jgi:hypothetical protein